MELKIKKISDKLDLDVEAQWNCNSSTNCYGPNYSDSPETLPSTGPAGAVYVICNSSVYYSYSTEGWSIF